MPRFIDKEVFLQSLLAFTFDIGGIVSGRIILLFLPLFKSSPWILALYPPILSTRGNIGGVFSGKLSTMLHIGEVEPRLRQNTIEFYSLIWATLFLSFTSTAGSGLIAFMVNYFFGNAVLDHLFLYVVIPPVTSLFAIALSIPFVSYIGVTAFRKGLDPSILLYPAMSTIDDILITVCYALVVTVTLLPGGLFAILFIAAVMCILFLHILVRRRVEKLFKRTIVEGGSMILLSSLLGILAGVGLVGLRDEIERKPSVLMLYPALIDTLGDIGSILGTMQTTKLALGYTHSFIVTLKTTLADLVSVEVAAALIHLVFAFVTFFMAGVTSLPSELYILLKIALMSNLLSFMFISVLSLLVATQTFKRGLDPDNFVIPAVTSVSDVGATISLYATLVILGV
ncbi:MAG: magnesium transporter [Candidatus Bathyarchaeia archaeon]